MTRYHIILSKSQPAYSDLIQTSARNARSAAAGNTHLSTHNLSGSFPQKAQISNLLYCVRTQQYRYHYAVIYYLISPLSHRHIKYTTYIYFSIAILL